MAPSDILVVGSGAVGVGLLVLGAVMWELRARSGGAGLLVGVGLGLGIFTFAAKLVLIVAYGLLGDRYLAHALAERPEREPAPRVATVSQSEWTPAGYVWEPLPPVAPAPHDNPTTPAKVALGRRLFHDPRLSADGTVACASCHLIAQGGADGRSVSEGVGGRRGKRNAPTVLNAAYQSVLFWDGRAASLEEQALGPLLDPAEMGLADRAELAARVAAVPAYRAAFARIFGGEAPVTADNVARALAAYQRTLVTPDTPYDRFVRGDPTALSTRQRRGMALFAAFGCVNCHRGPNFSDASLLAGDMPFRRFPAIPGTEHEIRYGLGKDPGAAAHGQGGVWRVPSLRNVTRTAPYFHNGAVEDLRQAVRIMAQVQLGRRYSNRPQDDWETGWDGGERVAYAWPNAAISDAEVEDIVAFLGALEGEVEP